jgi:hypothetical protein
MSTVHTSPHPLAGQTVTVTPDAFLQNDGTAPVPFRIEDWNDRLFGQSWMEMQGHPACLKYAVRSGLSGLPLDNEVVYGKCDDGFGHLVHVSEIQGGAA